MCVATVLSKRGISLPLSLSMATESLDEFLTRQGSNSATQGRQANPGRLQISHSQSAPMPIGESSITERTNHNCFFQFHNKNKRWTEFRELNGHGNLRRGDWNRSISSSLWSHLPCSGKSGPHYGVVRFCEWFRHGLGFLSWVFVLLCNDCIIVSDANFTSCRTWNYYFHAAGTLFGNVALGAF